MTLKINRFFESAERQKAADLAAKPNKIFSVLPEQQARSMQGDFRRAVDGFSPKEREQLDRVSGTPRQQAEQLLPLIQGKPGLKNLVRVCEILKDDNP